MEIFDWKKALTGMFDLTRWSKDAFTLVRLAIILGFCFIAWLGLKQINVMIAPKKAQPAVENISAQGEKSKVNSTVDSSVNAKKTWKFGILNT